MADTTAEKPKRRRTTKAADGDKAPRRAAEKKAALAKAESAPAKTAPARKPRKAVAAKPAASTAAKPRRAPQKRATAKPSPAPAPAAPAPSPAASRRPDLPEAPPRTGLLAALGTLAAVGGAFFVWRASRADEPRYQTIESDGPIEVRKYPALVTASAEARGQRREALNEGFKTLADYIFAKSRRGPKLDMTAPVLSDTEGKGSWRTRFVMPAGKARGELPAAPSGVELVSEPPARVAAIRFPGRADDATLAAKEGALRSWLQLKSLPSEGKAVHAFYNAPFLPGPLRRNEVMIKLSDEGGTGA